MGDGGVGVVARSPGLDTPRHSPTGSQDFLFELSHPILDYVDAVVQDLRTRKILNHWETGDLRPFAMRPINHRNFLFPLRLGNSAETNAVFTNNAKLTESQQLRLIMRIVSESSVLIPLKMWPERAFWEADTGYVLYIGIFYGIMLVMILYNLVTSLAMRTLSGYLYICYMIFITIYLAALDGILLKTWPSLVRLNDSYVLPGSLSQFFFSLFSIQFLNLRNSHRWLLAIFIFFGAVNVIQFFCGLFFGPGLALKLIFLFSPPFGVCAWIVAVVRLAQGYRPARYYLVGFSFLIVGSIIGSLHRSGVINSADPWIYRAIQIGTGIEAILLSFGLADRIRLIQKEKELAQANTIEQQRILNVAFARFVPAPFLQILGKKSIPDVLLGDYTEREMTILFADIRGFTTISEKLSPKQTFEFINEYLHGAGPVIRNNHGFIDKYMGDGIMALFEKPEDAISAAMRMQQRNERLNRRLGDRLVAPINVGIGIHTGHLMLGTIGEPQRMDGTVIADAVNLASRVESLTKQYGVDVLVTKEALAGLQTGTAERPWLRRFVDRIAVKGKSEPATLYEIVTIKNGRALKYSRNWLIAWNQALRLYYKREFSAALDLFEQLIKRLPDDKTALLFRERSERYLHKPPVEGWNGVAVAVSK